MNAREFYGLATELTKLRTPAGTRSAVSRGYYAAFHVGAEALRMLGFSISKGSAAHGEVQRCFLNSMHSDTVAAGQSLSELQSSRIRADYQLDRVAIENAKDALRILNIAQGVIEVFDGIPSNPQRPAIQSAIAAWRKSNGYP